MNDRDKNRQQLVKELAALRRHAAQQNARLAAAEEAEAELRRKHQLAQQYLDVAAVIMVTLDRDGKITLLNRKGHEILGYPAGSLLGRNWIDTCVPERLRPDILRTFRRLMAGELEQSEYYENPVVTRTGEERIIAWHNTLLTEDAGQILGTLSSGTDVTKRRRAEDALRHAHDQLEQRVEERTAELVRTNEELAIFRRFAEASTQGFGIASLRGRIVYANPAMCRLMGRQRPEELVGKHLSACLSDEYMRTREKEILPTVTRDGHWQGELTIALQGEEITCIQNSFLIRDARGAPAFLATVLIDITERKQAEAALRESEEKYRALVDTSPDGVVMTDLDGRILFASERVREMYGSDRAEDLLGRSAMDFIAPEHHDRFRASMATTLEQGVTRNTEYSFVRKEGARLAGEVSSALLMESSGAPRALVAILRDVTQRRQAQEALERERQTLSHMLQASDHERRLISYDIHDGLAQQLVGAVMHFECHDQLREQDPAKAATAYATGMTLVRASLAEARRLISGVRPPILDEEGVVAAINHLIHDGRADTAEVQVEFHHEVAFDRLAPVLENAVYRIVQEGLANALLHSQRDRVRIELTQCGGQLRVVVQDWGVGFNPEEEFAGCYGLKSVRERARLLGGTVTIVSAPDQGTTISAVLPVILADGPP